MNTLARVYVPDEEMTWEEWGTREGIQDTLKVSHPGAISTNMSAEGSGATWTGPWRILRPPLQGRMIIDLFNVLGRPSIYNIVLIHVGCARHLYCIEGLRGKGTEINEPF